MKKSVGFSDYNHIFINEEVLLHKSFSLAIITTWIVFSHQSILSKCHNNDCP